MELLTILNILESTLTRKTVSLKNDSEGCSWSSDDLFSASFTIDEDTTEIEDVIQICLVNKNDEVYVYINYNNRQKYLKLLLEDIDIFEVTI